MADSTADAGSRSSIRTATPQLSFWASAAVGGCSGATVDCVLFPLDTLKTRLQQRRQPGAQLPALQLRSFYRGLLSAMTGSFPSAATFWGVYEASKAATSHLAPPDDELQQGVRHAVCGATADVASAIVRNPFEVVKQQMQAGLHPSTSSAVRSILRAEGPAGLYAGVLSTVARDVPFSAVQFALYELMKRRLARAQQRELLWWENAGLGAVAGGTAAAATTPLDVIKTRMMTQTGTAVAHRYTGWSHALRTIVREEGAGAFLAGLRPRVAWISVGGAVFIGSFEEMKRWALRAKN